MSNAVSELPAWHSAEGHEVAAPTSGDRPHFQIFVYHHTHWDREWWATFQDFRIKLVELIDSLLDQLDRDPAYRCFMLDGQTIVLKDYLEIRPENKEKLIGYINAGRVQCGPWHILPDEFLVSAEAHVRNLWLGQRTSEQLGYTNTPIGYLPDTFGHISQIPQLLRGFGIDNALIWRGVGGAGFKQEFLWEAPDGSQVLGYWFPDGYYMVDFLHFDNPAKTYEQTYGRVRRSLERWVSRATSDLMLMPYGGDHRPIDRRLPRLLDQVNEDIKDIGELRWGTVAEYLDAVRARDPQLTVHRGECRAFGPDLPPMLPGVLSTRLYLKRRNFYAQLWLERYAEPLSALAWRHGRRYDSGLLWTAWDLLVQNHPHDSICGCSIDQVHREMLPRFDQSSQIAQILTEKSAQHIAGLIDTSSLDEGEEALVIFNPLPWIRDDSASVLVDRRLAVHPRTHVLKDPEGKELPFQVRDVDAVRLLHDRYQFTELRFAAAEVPALGYQIYRLGKRETPLDPKQLFLATIQPSSALKGSAPLTDLRVGNGVLENRHLRVEVGADGLLSVTDRQTGARYEGLNVFEDGGDAGDTYNYAPPLNDMLLRSTQGARAHVSVAEAGHAAATLRVDLDWALPVGLAADRLSRSSTYQEVRISTYVTLAAGARRVEVRTVWDNRSADHRLRALFPLGAPAAVSHAEGHFDVVERPVGLADTGNGWKETNEPTIPQQGFVSVQSGARGLTLLNKGLPECEVLADGQGTVALTLLRAVGWLSRDDTLARIEGAGPQLPTPEAQCLGENEVEYAIVPHAGSWLESGAYLTAHAYQAPLYGTLTTRHEGVLPRRDGLLELEGDHTLLLSACKRAERAEALVLRFWNVAKQPTSARVRLHQRPAAVTLVDLKEQPLGPLALEDDGSFVLAAGPAQIVTIAISL